MTSDPYFWLGGETAVHSRNRKRVSNPDAKMSHQRRHHGIDLTGHKYEKLVVLREAEPAGPSAQGRAWLCRCVCGNEKVFRGKDLRRPGNTISCGCHRKVVLNNMAKRQKALQSPLRAAQKRAVAAIAASGGNLRWEDLKERGSKRALVDSLKARCLVREWGGIMTLTVDGRREAALQASSVVTSA